jgi:hypothetical protein
LSTRDCQPANCNKVGAVEVNNTGTVYDDALVLIHPSIYLCSELGEGKWTSLKKEKKKK